MAKLYRLKKGGWLVSCDCMGTIEMIIEQLCCENCLFYFVLWVTLRLFIVLLIALLNSLFTSSVIETVTLSIVHSTGKYGLIHCLHQCFKTLVDLVGWTQSTKHSQVTMLS